jgi:PAS domain-containing protein
MRRSAAPDAASPLGAGAVGPSGELWPGGWSGLANLYRLLLPPVLLRPVSADAAEPDGRRLRSAAGLSWSVRILLRPRRAVRLWPARSLAQPAAFWCSRTPYSTRRLWPLCCTAAEAGRQRPWHSARHPGRRHGAAGGRARHAFAVAAIAALGILLQQIASVAFGNAPWADYQSAGHGRRACCFWSHSRPGRCPIACARVRRSVRRAVLDLANLAQLSQYIVQHLRESILVVDPSGGIRLINEAAAQVLGRRGRAARGAARGSLPPIAVSAVDLAAR